jgi:DNA polymerase-3 subunit epsilon
MSFRYAIIDVETTGGKPGADRITEVAIVIHDGKNVLETFSSLINPGTPITYYVSKLTGITDDMVRDAPAFHEVAKHIIELTQDCIFVAHNVRFDYNMIRDAYRDLGYVYQRKTLCTVRLSREAFPGFPSYSLGNLCKSLNIVIENRHRALGDAEATAILFGKIMEARPELFKEQLVLEEVRKTSWPPELPEDALNSIPERCTGIYYFHNAQGDLLYIGKSTDIRKRIIQHFAITGKGNRRANQLKQKIASISIEPTGSELVALLLESDEIKKHRPPYNISQKRIAAIPNFGLFAYTDEQGYTGIKIERYAEDSKEEPVITFDQSRQAKRFLEDLADKHALCQKYLDLHHVSGPCFKYQLHKCLGACIQKEPAPSFNSRLHQALERYRLSDRSFLIIGPGRVSGEKSIVWIQEGRYKGFGFAETIDKSSAPHELIDSIKPYPNNKDVKQILSNWIRQKKPTMIPLHPID